MISFLSYDLSITNPSEPRAGLTQRSAPCPGRGGRSQLRTPGRGPVPRVSPRAAAAHCAVLPHFGAAAGKWGRPRGFCTARPREQPGGCGIPSPPRGAGAGRVSVCESECAPLLACFFFFPYPFKEVWLSLPAPSLRSLSQRPWPVDGAAGTSKGRTREARAALPLRPLPPPRPPGGALGLNRFSLFGV